MLATEIRLITISVLTCTSYCAGAEEPNQEQVCAQVYCRVPTTITLRLDDDTAMDFEVEGIPVAFERDVNLFPGEAVELSVTIEDGEIKSLNYDPEADDATGAISVRFSQNDDEPYGMMLVVKNSLERYLRYKAFIAMPNQDGFVYTSSCPVGPDMSAFESWPHPISHILLTNIHLVDVAQDGGSAELTCE
jgi:hypothetical protein